MIELHNVHTYRAQMLAYHAGIEAERKVFFLIIGFSRASFFCLGISIL